MACFSPLKKAFGVEIGDFMRVGIIYVSKEDFLPAFFKAYMKAIIPENITSGFRATGLVLFDPEIVISELEVALISSTPSPPPELPTTTWVSKTPTNVYKAVLQSVFLKNRIAKHQNSSLSEIINTVASLLKATYLLMHRQTLLLDRITRLEEANHILSKRRKRKNKRLQAGGVLSLKEGIDIQVSKEGSNSIEQANGESSGRRRRVSARARRCGICGNTGHNARTCTVDVETSNNEDCD